jgi:hypothetical protein
MVIDCAWANKHPCGYFAVGKSFSRQLRDLRLLRSQISRRALFFWSVMLPGSTVVYPGGGELGPCPLGKNPSAHGLEHIGGCSKLGASIMRSPCVPQPFAQQQMGASQVRGDVSGSEPVDGLFEEDLAILAPGQNGA